MVLQPDGKIVVVGLVVTDGLAGEDFALARYNADGSPDASFGNGGRVTTDIGGTDEARAIALQADGRLIVGGLSISRTSPPSSDFALARYNTDGVLDVTFGDEGKVITRFGGPGEGVSAMAVRPDGRIIAVGTASTGSTEAFALARYDVDGTLDGTFGAGGTATSVGGGSP